jgi:hypothetical protein
MRIGQTFCKIELYVGDIILNINRHFYVHEVVCGT